MVNHEGNLPWLKMIINFGYKLEFSGLPGLNHFLIYEGNVSFYF